jgi:putative glycosyltransferase (TIGR04348 family)
MRIRVVSPAPRDSQAGNNITAARWAALLQELGHEVTVASDARGEWDLLIALHARRSFPVVVAARDLAPTRPIFVALTGTDLYGDLPGSHEARQALEWATRILVLQPRAIEALPEGLRGKARVVIQSAQPPAVRPAPEPDTFEVCVLGHLREVKDPFCAAEAAQLLPAGSRIVVTQAGAALSPEYAERARAEMRVNPRYRWLGELPRGEAMSVLARSRLLALTSLSEGGANVVSEALAAGTPVVSSRIDGSLGILGEAYPGYFTPGSRSELAALLARAEADAGFYRGLREQCAALAPLVTPERERSTWESLIQELDNS